MATYTSNYAWTKPGGNEQVDISVLNANLDSQDGIMHKAFTNMAQAFSESSTYAVDDIVLYDTGLYKCHTAVVTPGSWTGSTNWQAYKLSEGGGGGLTLGETSSTAYRGDRGKTAYDHSQSTGNPHSTTAADVGLGNVPNVSTNDQTPTFTEASTRNNIASGEKLSVILGKIQKFFNDLKTVAFTGSYTDLTNKPETTVIDWDDWNQLTPQEQESGSYTITDCPWADGNVSVDLMTKLWENPSPTSSFAAQNVTLSSDDYDYLIAVCNATTSGRTISTLIKKGTSGTVVLATCRGAGATYTTIYNRDFERIDNTHYAVGSAYAQNSNGTREEDNAKLIPITFYGIKTTASVKINAIAMDVSTSADKCMLSDGVTSVEDAIECTQTTAGNYRLRATVSAGGAVTYSWVAE